MTVFIVIDITPVSYFQFAPEISIVATFSTREEAENDAANRSDGFRKFGWASVSVTTV